MASHPSYSSGTRRQQSWRTRRSAAICTECLHPLTHGFTATPQANDDANPGMPQGLKSHAENAGPLRSLDASVVDGGEQSNNGASTGIVFW